MCLFPKKSIDNYVPYYKCGKCPECLSQKASHWASRAYYQSLESKHAFMCTLTYNNKIYERGRVVGESLPSQLKVDVRDCQLFFKRLRKAFPNNKIKYLITAEYGSRTHRPHYHAIIFGLKLVDIVPYKKSKRGNKIYISRTLEKIWQHGICTVDSINITPSIVRYCTKYCVKDSGNDDTFMLVSQGIGVNEMLRRFTGKPYVIEGRSYPIPRIVWQQYIARKYKYFYKQGDTLLPFDYRYRNREHPDYELFRDLRILYSRVRNSDSVYQAYINSFEKKPYKSVFERLSALDDRKYNFYKAKAFIALQNAYKYPVSCPRDKKQTTLYKFLYNRALKNDWMRGSFVSLHSQISKQVARLAAMPCHIAASDTKRQHPYDLLLQKDYVFRVVDDRMTRAEFAFYCKNGYKSSNWLFN